MFDDNTSERELYLDELSVNTKITIKLLVTKVFSYDKNKKNPPS